MPEPIDFQLSELFQLYADDQLDSEQAETLQKALREDVATRDAFVAFCLHAQLLKEVLAEEAELSGRTSLPLMESADEKPNSRRTLSIAVAVMAACVLVVIGVWNRLDGLRPDQTAARWKITPTGDADYEFVEPTRVRLHRGELLVESDPAVPGEPLSVITPAGEAVASGTRFYIGAHQASIKKDIPMFQPITRVLILTGIVSLATSAGSVEGTEGDLLAAEPDQMPVRVTVKANSDFAFDLYRRLAGQNGGGNLFFSPYSISGALAMTAEGARGETAKEIGNVLRFPEACRRIGKDTQLIPWKTSLIHTGYATLNKRLHSSQTNPDYQKIKSQIDRLEKEYRAIDAEVIEMGNAAFGGGFGEGKAKKPFDQKEFEKLAGQRDRIGRELAGLESQISLYELRVANAIWGEKSYPFRKDYIDTIQKHYRTGGMFPVDFRKNFLTARQKINDWCAGQTKDRIREILPLLPPEQGRMLRIVLTNAIYFKADWRTRFDPRLTRNQGFTQASGDKVQTPIMQAPAWDEVRYAAFQGDGSFFNTPAVARPDQTKGLYPDADGFAMVELPYRGDDVSMLVIAPNRHDGLEAIEEQLDAASLARWVEKLQKRATTVALPRFRQETSCDLKKTLNEMGMTKAFDPVAADFSGMSDSASEPIYLGLVRHKAFVEVNEAGTEAAAVTVVGGFLGGPSGSPPFIPEFRADRPFLYIIRDVASGSILFLGRMAAPVTEDPVAED